MARLYISSLQRKLLERSLSLLLFPHTGYFNILKKMEPSLIIESINPSSEFIVEKSKERLDIYLVSQLPEISRSRLQNLIEQGHVQINNKTCLTKKTIVQAGDRISLSLPTPKPLELQAQNIPLTILYEDEHLIIINKPAGLVVHPAPGHEDGTLVNALLAHCPDLSGIGGIQRPGIVHRLDKDTTGAIVIAKNDYTHQNLQAQIQAKTARREYLGVVFGTPKTTEGSIDLPIGRNPTDGKKMAIIPLEKGGRAAVTHWQIKERLGNYTLIHFQLETGRTHQIRIHSAQIGHPIIGDPLYSSNKSIGVNLKGQALHAWKLILQHPVTGEIIEATAPLPDNFITLLDVLRRRN